MQLYWKLELEIDLEIRFARIASAGRRLTYGPTAPLELTLLCCVKRPLGAHFTWGGPLHWSLPRN